MPKSITLNKDQKKTIVSETLPQGDIVLKKNSHLTYISILKKGWKGKKILNISLNGENAEVDFLAIILGEKSETFDFETNSIHKSPHTKGNFTIRSVLNDSSQVEFKGNLKIEKKAQSTNVYLAHHTLMLSDKSKTNTIPCLEIEADEVKAGHSATIGKLDDDSIFYIKSRGLSKMQAEKMLIKSFIEQDIQKITDEELKKEIYAKF